MTVAKLVCGKNKEHIGRSNTGSTSMMMLAITHLLSVQSPQVCPYWAKHVDELAKISAVLLAKLAWAWVRWYSVFSIISLTKSMVSDRARVRPSLKVSSHQEETSKSSGTLPKMLIGPTEKSSVISKQKLSCLSIHVETDRWRVFRNLDGKSTFVIRD